MSRKVSGISTKTFNKMSKKKQEKEQFDINAARKQTIEHWGKLTDFRNGYTVDRLIADLLVYFDNEVDFNLDKIREIVSADGKLQELIDRAIKNNSHPVSEFIMEMVKSVKEDK
jgi:hypothetical protein